MSEPTGEIRFTQYMRPDGRPKPIVIERPMPVVQKSERIRDAGLAFEAEVLLSGQVSMTITSDEADLDCVVCDNGPDVLAAVDSMILGFDIEAALVRAASDE